MQALDDVRRDRQLMIVETGRPQIKTQAGRSAGDQRGNGDDDGAEYFLNNFFPG
ncbi:hypothetical protein [Duganella sp. P38]|uniref:hypothetical protein n=1 Tax=Duganella sp. P38 TaxID=3423949 RepID=UPI003D7B24B2